MKTVWILGDQLSPENAALLSVEKESAQVLMIESKARGRVLRYHQQKLALLYTAMRHFARDLRGAGWTVDYILIERGLKFDEALQEHVGRYHPSEVLVAEPNSFLETDALQKVARKLDVPLQLVPTRQFLCSREEFRDFAAGKLRLLMEHHYRRMRKKFGFLVRNGKPEGGQWNYDPDNRLSFSEWKRRQPTLSVRPPSPEHDEITREVIATVKREFQENPGDAAGLWVPVDREAAKAWLAHFIKHRLSRFGDFEDVMVDGEPVVYHSVLSPLLNLGLLTPQECVEAATEAYANGSVPLNAVEGFVRQIIGWREFINGVYWLRGPAYKELNGLNAMRPLPEWYYTGETPMRCLHKTLKQTLELGWNHHIQRLMVLGNFILLAGIAPSEALRWFEEMYIDAYDWVMVANVIGMICHADGGFMATKPYAASGAYINRMSNYCEGCVFSPKEKTGPRACPFNLLYWNFYDKHGDKFADNQRTKMTIRAWTQRPESEKQVIRAEAAAVLETHVPATT